MCRKSHTLFCTSILPPLKVQPFVERVPKQRTKSLEHSEKCVANLIHSSVYLSHHRRNSGRRSANCVILKPVRLLLIGLPHGGVDFAPVLSPLTITHRDGNISNAAKNKEKKESKMRNVFKNNKA